MVPLCAVPYQREEWHLLQKQLRLRRVLWKEQGASFLGAATVWIHEANLENAREAVSETERLFAKLRARRRHLEPSPPTNLRAYFH